MNRQTFKKALHFLYGMGGAVVIVRALAKILHIDILGISGSVLLGAGLGMEAFIFAVASFDFSGIEEDTTPKEALNLEFSEVSTTEIDGVEFGADALNFCEEPKPLEEVMVAESEAVKNSMMELNENVQQLSNMYGDMIKTMKK